MPDWRLDCRLSRLSRQSPPCCPIGWEMCLELKAAGGVFTLAARGVQEIRVCTEPEQPQPGTGATWAAGLGIHLECHPPSLTCASPKHRMFCSFDWMSGVRERTGANQSELPRSPAGEVSSGRLAHWSCCWAVQSLLSLCKGLLGLIVPFQVISLSRDGTDEQGRD